MREKLARKLCIALPLLLAVAAVQSKETMRAEETVYFPTVVDSRSKSYQILNDSFLREKLDYTAKADADRKSKVQYEIIPLKDVDLKTLYSKEQSTNIQPHQIKSISYQDTSLNDKYKVYTGFLPNKDSDKFQTPRYQEKYPKQQSDDYSPKYSATDKPNPYTDTHKYPADTPKRDPYQESPVERYTENPKPYLESLKRYPESPRKDSYQESPVERYTENPKPYLESVKRYPPEVAPKKESYPVSSYTENPKSYVEPLRYPEILKEDSFRKLYGPVSTTPRPYNRYSENPKPLIESYTAKPQTAVGYPVASGNRYTENPKVAVESYSPRPYGEQSGAPSRYNPSEKPTKPLVRYNENPSRPVAAIESYATPPRYPDNPKSLDTYNPRPVTYKPPTRYPETPVRYTENPKPVIETYTAKPYTERPSYTTARPSYPVQRYPENPKPAPTQGYYPPVTARPKYESYSTTPAYQKKLTNDYRPSANRYEKRPAGYKPLYGSTQPDGYEIYVPEEYDDDYSAIPGKPGLDYPIFDVPPFTYFNCVDQDYAGYYADVEARCQVFHICQADGRANAFLCPNGTLFNQQFFVCDWWYNVNCEYAPALYSLNAHLYETPYRRPNY